MKKRIKKPGRFFWLLTMIIVMQACYPGDSIPIADLDTTSTFYNTDHLATAPTSASIAWEVVHIEFDDGNDLKYDGKADDEILNTTLDELVKLYGEDSVIIISETMNPPDYDPATYPGVRIVVPDSVDSIAPYVESVYLPSVVLREKEVTYYYPGYGWWGGWWGWYGYSGYSSTDPSNSYYYPGYPGGCYWCYGGGFYGSVTYEVGTVLVDMVDLRQILVDDIAPEDVEYSWVAVMRGLLGNTSSTKERVISGIQQAFRQSPYLDPNK